MPAVAQARYFYMISAKSLWTLIWTTKGFSISIMMYTYARDSFIQEMIKKLEINPNQDITKFLVDFFILGVLIDSLTILGIYFQQKNQHLFQDRIRRTAVTYELDLTAKSSEEL